MATEGCFISLPEVLENVFSFLPFHSFFFLHCPSFFMPFFPGSSISLLGGECMAFAARASGLQVSIDQRMDSQIWGLFWKGFPKYRDQ